MCQLVARSLMTACVCPLGGGRGPCSEACGQLWDCGTPTYVPHAPCMRGQLELSLLPYPHALLFRLCLQAVVLSVVQCVVQSVAQAGTPFILFVIVADGARGPTRPPHGMCPLAPPPLPALVVSARYQVGR